MARARAGAGGEWSPGPTAAGSERTVASLDAAFDSCLSGAIGIRERHAAFSITRPIPRRRPLMPEAAYSQVIHR
jgi:hypothetical protein